MSIEYKLIWSQPHLPRGLDRSLFHSCNNWQKRHHCMPLRIPDWTWRSSTLWAADFVGWPVDPASGKYVLFAPDFEGCRVSKPLHVTHSKPFSCRPWVGELMGDAMLRLEGSTTSINQHKHLMENSGSCFAFSESWSLAEKHRTKVTKYLSDWHSSDFQFQLRHAQRWL